MGGGGWNKRDGGGKLEFNRFQSSIALPQGTYDRCKCFYTFCFFKVGEIVVKK